MPFTSAPITVKDSAGAARPLIAFNDGTNSAFANALLDSAGALVSPATAANQATANASLAAVAASVAGATPAGANVIGRVGIDQTTPGTTNGVQVVSALPAGTSTIGSVSAASNSSGGVSTYLAAGGTAAALLTNTPVAVKAGSASLYGVSLVNTGSSAAYVQLFDAAAGSVTLGTTAPKMAFWVPANGAWEEKFTGEAKVAFATALTMAAATTATGGTAPATGILATVLFK